MYKFNFDSLKIFPTLHITKFANDSLKMIIESCAIYLDMEH